MRVPRSIGTTLALLALSGPGTALASPCDRAAGTNPCVDAEALWVPAGRPVFLGIPEAHAPAEDRVTLALATSYARRPIVLNVASPDPDGRDIDVVKDVVTTSVLWSYAPTASLELAMALPFTPYQRGAGSEALASQSPSALGRTAVRDPRLGVAYALPMPTALEPLAARALVELALPLGDEERFATSGGFTVAPGLLLGARHGALELGAQVGLRLRRSVPLENVRVGSETVSLLGVRVALLGDDLLALALEAHLRSSLASQPNNVALMPAEWLLSVQSAPTSDPAFVVQLGGGTALPLSSERRDGETSHFAGVTTPSFRGVAVLRYAPR